jgi:hypothetical protein
VAWSSRSHRVPASTDVSAKVVATRSTSARWALEQPVSSRTALPSSSEVVGTGLRCTSTSYPGRSERQTIFTRSADTGGLSWEDARELDARSR